MLQISTFHSLAAKARSYQAKAIIHQLDARSKSIFDKQIISQLVRDDAIPFGDEHFNDVTTSMILSSMFHEPSATRHETLSICPLNE